MRRAWALSVGRFSQAGVLACSGRLACAGSTRTRTCRKGPLARSWSTAEAVGWLWLVSSTSTRRVAAACSASASSRRSWSQTSTNTASSPAKARARRSTSVRRKSMGRADLTAVLGGSGLGGQHVLGHGFEVFGAHVGVRRHGHAAPFAFGAVLDGLHQAGHGVLVATVFVGHALVGRADDLFVFGVAGQAAVGLQQGVACAGLGLGQAGGAQGQGGGQSQKCVVSHGSEIQIKKTQVEGQKLARAFAARLAPDAGVQG